MPLKLIPLLALLFLTACTGTSIVRDWQDDDFEKAYSNVFIIAISDSQQNRRIFENLLVAELKALGVEATPSYSLISSRETIDRETVVAAIRESDIDFDAVLVTYLVDTETEVHYQDSPITETYSGSPDTNMLSSTLIGTRGRYNVDEIIELKSDLYDVAARELVWSINTRTRGAESIDELIVEVTESIRDELLSDDKIAQ
jgi:uncharacterized membrane-anchored protein